MRAGCPATQAKRLGAYWTTTIGRQSVVVFKSESHMSQDGPQLPNIDVWRQIIQEVQPKLVLTTGTAGGIGTSFEVGDVVVSPVVRFDCIQKFKTKPFATAHYTSSSPSASRFAAARSLFKFNSDQLPKDNTRPPRIFKVPVKAIDRSVLTRQSGGSFLDRLFPRTAGPDAGKHASNRAGSARLRIALDCDHEPTSRCAAG